jgi:hypothetical protein
LEEAVSALDNFRIVGSCFGLENSELENPVLALENFRIGRSCSGFVSAFQGGWGIVGVN